MPQLLVSDSQPTSGRRPHDVLRPHDVSPSHSASRQLSRFALACLALGFVLGLLSGCGTTKRLGRFYTDAHAERAVHAAAFLYSPAAPHGDH